MVDAGCLIEREASSLPVSAVQDVRLALPPMTATCVVGHARFDVGAQVIGSHHVVGAAESFAGDHGDLADGCLDVRA